MASLFARHLTKGISLLFYHEKALFYHDSNILNNTFYSVTFLVKHLEQLVNLRQKYYGKMRMYENGICPSKILKINIKKTFLNLITMFRYLIKEILST